MSKKVKQSQQVKASDSRLERDLADLIDGKGVSGLRLLMGQMAALEQDSSKFYVTSRPACNSD